MPSAPDPPPAVLSPNSVLANALLRTIDMIRPQVVANRPRLVSVDDDGAIFTAVCYEHGDYELCIDPIDGGYLDLATLYRNLIKERALVRERDVLYVMVKGGDWAFGAQLVDGALLALGTPAADMPARVFTPMVLSGSGAKLSKSLLRAA